MKRKSFLQFVGGALVVLLVQGAPAQQAQVVAAAVTSSDVVVVGATPGGIMAAIAAARRGRSVTLLERSGHIGGLPANGLGATDIATRGATGGLFAEFVGRNRAFYVKTYGEDSQQVKDCSDGYRFEPHIAEKIFTEMLAEQPSIRVLLGRQFDALPANVRLDGSRLAEIKLSERQSGAMESYEAKAFIDATYEGDLAAAAGVPYRLGREGKAEYNEPMAGVLYRQWEGADSADSSGLADNAIQAYNYRCALTSREDNRVAITKPEGYQREEYASLIEDLKLNRTTAASTAPRHEREWDGIGRVVNMVILPNGKTDANHQHASFISTDLAEENWPWPTSSWEWRDRYALRLRNYILGLLWFAQNDPGLPEEFRARSRQWGLAKDEYVDNGNFPRQVYVREGRRMEGEHRFTALDAIPVKDQVRPPVYVDSITASHYPLDSHACHKREPGKVHLDGFFSMGTKPYTVPFGTIVPKKVDGLLVPVAVSATHIGFGTLRMEPCWMALGQAAGVAASLSIEESVPVRKLSVPKLQQTLLEQRGILIYYKGATPSHRSFAALQYFGLRGVIPGWELSLDEVVKPADAEAWIAASGGVKPAGYQPGKTSNGEFLELLRAAVR